MLNTISLQVHFYKKEAADISKDRKQQRTKKILSEELSNRRK